MKNEITFGILAVAIVVAIVIIAISTIVLNNSIQIASAQAGFPPGLTRGLEDTLFGNSQQITTICHVPPGNPANSHTIQISNHALRAHLAHGDIIGACTA